MFSVTSRNAIENQVSRLSLIGVALIATLLLLVYRSLTALLLARHDGYYPCPHAT